MRRSRKIQIPVDDHVYALRNRIERCFNKLKNFRRLATRYDKTADSYLGFVLIAAVRLWTRVFVKYPRGDGGSWRHTDDPDAAKPQDPDPRR
nr:transposase [Siculibacillus lacustris]